MLAEFLTRLAIALPLVCATAVLCLWLARRGWLRFPGGFPLLFAPGFPGRFNGRFGKGPAYGEQGTAATGRGWGGHNAPESPLELVAMRSLSPAARVAVVRFAGRDHLIAVSGQSVSLLARAPLPSPQETP